MSDQAHYIISVAARLVEMHPQTLRKYERAGLVEPSRSDGNLRLYSGEDIRRLLQIKRLVDERGVNLAGVELALSLTTQLQALDDLLRTDPIDRAAVQRQLQAMRVTLGVVDPPHNGGTHGQSHRH